MNKNPVWRLTRDELEVKPSTWRTQTSYDSVELSRGRSSFQEDTPVAALMGEEQTLQEFTGWDERLEFCG